MRKLMVLLILVVISAAGIAVSTPKVTNDASNHYTTTMQQQPEIVIDGQLNPEKIPDHEAYTILFRLIARRETEAEKQRVRFYLRQALGCNGCDKNKEVERTAEAENADIDAMIAAAEEFDQRVSTLDQQATEIQDRYHPTHPPMAFNDKEYLKQLQKQKESIVVDVVASLPQRLSSEGLKNLRKHIKERMKPKMKMFMKQEAS
jgi:hypothetical protein